MMMLNVPVWFAIAVLIAMTNAADLQPKMSGNKDKSYVVQAGTTVKLKCRATGSDDTNLERRTLFYWTKVNGRHKGLVKPQKFPRFEIKQGKFLKIRNVQQEDAGVYMCSATNAFGSESVKRKLDVIGVAKHRDSESVAPTGKPLLQVPYALGDSEIAPQLLKPRVPVVRKTYSSGDDMRLRCLVRANPQPTLQWKFNNISIQQSGQRMHFASGNGLLTISEVRPGDAGNYTCLARNSLGSISVRYEIIIESASKHIASTNYTAVLGGNLTLTCVSHMPKTKGTLPRIQWRRYMAAGSQERHVSPVEGDTKSRRSKKRATFVAVTQRDSWKFNVMPNRTLVSHFTISRNVSWEHAGRYVCYVGKPDNWRLANAVHVNVEKGEDPVPSDSTSKDDNDAYVYGIPLFVLIGVPVLAGCLCLAVVILCWRHSKKSVSAPEVRSGIIYRESSGTHTRLSLCSRKGKPMEATLSSDHTTSAIS